MTGRQLTFFDFTKPEVTYPLQPVKKSRIREQEKANIIEEIEEKKEEISKLQKEIRDAQDEIEAQELLELDLEPEPGNEDIFDARVPEMESDFLDLKYENESEIRRLECEIAELEKGRGEKCKLKVP
jgi:hypothetical protein